MLLTFTDISWERIEELDFEFELGKVDEPDLLIEKSKSPFEVVSAEYIILNEE